MSPKKRKSYLVVMALGGVALIVDRVILTDVDGSPNTAIASAGATNDLDALVNTPSVGAALTTAAIPELPFPKLPKTTGFSADTRDMFEPPRRVVSRTAEPDNQDSDFPVGSQGDDVETFRSRHRLSGLLLHQGLKIAVVNGRWMRINDALDGCELVSVLPDRAVFKCRDGQAELTILPVLASQPPG